MVVVVREGSTIFEQLAGKDESLLIRGDAHVVMDLCLDDFSEVGGLGIDSDDLASQCLDKDLVSCHVT